MKDITDELNENTVTEYIVSYLEKEGYRDIISKNTNQRGIDIEAMKGKEKIYMEIKGATTSKNGKRHGKPFTNPQVFDRVAKGICTAIHLRQKMEKSSRIAVGFPDTILFKKHCNEHIQEFLIRNKIEIFWVKKDRSIHIQNYR